MSLIRNKRGFKILYAAVIFVILNLVFISVMFFFVARASSSVSFTEQAYARQVALLVDSAKPGTVIEMDIAELYVIASQKSVQPSITLNCDTNEVTVKLTSGRGYRFGYFSEIEDCSSDSIVLDPGKRRATIKV